MADSKNARLSKRQQYNLIIVALYTFAQLVKFSAAALPYIISAN